jgi:hypothetical protein
MYEDDDVRNSQKHARLTLPYRAPNHPASVLTLRPARNNSSASTKHPVRISGPCAAHINTGKIEEMVSRIPSVAAANYPLTAYVPNCGSVDKSI